MQRQRLLAGPALLAYEVFSGGSRLLGNTGHVAVLLGLTVGRFAGDGGDAIIAAGARQKQRGENRRRRGSSILVHHGFLQRLRIMCRSRSSARRIRTSRARASAVTI